MYNEIVIARLYTCLEHVEAIERYFNGAKNSEHFFSLDEGMHYDAALMRLQSLGENLKRISQKHHFVIVDLAYSEIDNVIRFRDYVSHHYEQLEHSVVFDICSIKVPELKTCISSLIKKHEKT